MSVEKKAFEAYATNRKLAVKYQVGDNMWMDWYKKGYSQSEKDLKLKAIEAYKTTCIFSGGTCMIKKEAGRCDCDELKYFVEELNKNNK